MLTVRRKILGVVVALSLVILAFGATVAFTTLKAASGPSVRYMEEHFGRFRFMLEQSGSGDLVAATIIASDPEVVRALQPAEATPAVVETRDPKDPKEPAGREAEPQKPPRPAGSGLDEALERLTRAVDVGADPDLIVIVDAGGDPISGKGLTRLSPSSMKQSRLFQDARAGMVRSRYAVIESVPYLVSAAPVEARGSRGAAVGAVVIGRKLGTFFELHAPHTSDKPERQQRASFVKGSAVLASALPKDEWAPFGAETAKGLENFKRERQQDQLVPVLEVAGKTYDFASATVPGYDGAQSPDAPVGQIFLVRSRRAESDALRNKGMELGAWFAGAGVVAILVGWALALHITRPIDRYIAATQGLAEGQGDLTQRLEVHAQDELGRLATNLNRVFEKIHALAGRVQKAAFRVGDSSDKLSGVARAMLDGAKAQAIKIENSTAAVTELSASIQQVAENAGEATKVAQKSGSAAENAIQRLAQIRRAVEDAAARIEALGESGKRIGSIVEVIRHISEQTTLLALNAAIEAAHAGEQGRGFAVVADEVSNLAKRVGRSAKDIEDLIATIRDQTSEAVRAMQVGTREVEEGTQLVVSTLADLKTLIGVVEDTATAVNEQAIASDEIARNMDAVRTIAREVLGASEQAATEGDQLTRLAVVLEESVKGFKIDASKIQDVDGGSLPPSASSVPSRQLPARRPGN